MTLRSKTFDRQIEIVQATLDLLGEVPMASLSTRQIAKRLGISQPALFRHFRSRETIMMAVMDHVRSELAALADAVLQAVSEPEKRLQTLADRLISYVAEHPGVARLLFSPPEEGHLRNALRQLVSMQQALISQVIRDGQDVGTFRRQLDPDEAATFFVGMIQGIVLRAQLFSNMRSPEHEVQSMFSLWLGGVRTNGSPEEEDTTHTTGAPKHHLIALDVRPVLKAGTDPLERILSTLETVVPRGVLSIVAPFRPTPLLRLLTEKGHGVSVREIAAEMWIVDIVVGGEIEIENLELLEAPLPLERVLEAVSTLASGAVFLARLPKYPSLLLPHLSARNVDFRILETADGTALLHARGQ